MRKKVLYAICFVAGVALVMGLTHHYKVKPKSFLKMTDAEILRCVAY